MVGKRFEIYLINLDPTVGSEIQKSRPCVIISPDDVNKYLNTLIIVPLTSSIRNFPTRVNCVVDGRNGQLAVDQIRSVDKSRLIKKIAALDSKTSDEVLKLLRSIFTY